MREIARRLKTYAGQDPFRNPFLRDEIKAILAAYPEEKPVDCKHLEVDSQAAFALDDPDGKPIFLYGKQIAKTSQFFVHCKGCNTTPKLEEVIANLRAALKEVEERHKADLDTIRMVSEKRDIHLAERDSFRRKLELAESALAEKDREIQRLKGDIRCLTLDMKTRP